jgi:hypothetical protein
VKGQNYLGIYLGKDTATVVCVGLEGRNHSVLGCFSISVEKTEGQKLQELERLITEGCAERDLQFSEVAVALDCAIFMQHNVHSEFSDPKQIAATIRFDAEEALAMDITDLAIAFKTTSSDQTGSKLAVFTAQQKQLSDIILSLQSNNIDPITIEPDVNCLSRFILQNISLPQDSHSLFCALSRDSGYFIAFGKSQETLALRTFLVSPTQDRAELLAREVPVTTTLVGTEGPINYIKAFDSTGSANYQQISEKLGIEVGSIDLAEAATTDPETLADCTDPVDFAIAYGAALSQLEKVQSVNFRNDFMPYQGKKVRLQKTLKFLSVSMIVLMLAMGLYFQLQLLQKNKYRSQLRKKFEKEYSAVMLGKKPPPKSSPAKKLAGELRRIRDVKSGQLSITGEESISAKLTLVLEAFNKCAAQTNLNIETITITNKNIGITGDTSSSKNTLKLFDAIRKSKLEILQQSLYTKGGRNNFRITVEPKK